MGSFQSQRATRHGQLERAKSSESSPFDTPDLIYIEKFPNRTQDGATTLKSLTFHHKLSLVKYVKCFLLQTRKLVGEHSFVCHSSKIAILKDRHFNQLQRYFYVFYMCINFISWFHYLRGLSF